LNIYIHTQKCTPAVKKILRVFIIKEFMYTLHRHTHKQTRTLMGTYMHTCTHSYIHTLDTYVHPWGHQPHSWTIFPGTEGVSPPSYRGGHVWCCCLASRRARVASPPRRRAPLFYRLWRCGLGEQACAVCAAQA